MKIKVEMTLDLDDSLSHLSDEQIQDIVAEGFPAYAVKAHLRDAIAWATKNGGGTAQSDSHLAIQNHHAYWADVLSESMPSLRIEKE